jgi:hypothetical protein
VCGSLHRSEFRGRRDPAPGRRGRLCRSGR